MKQAIHNNLKNQKPANESRFLSVDPTGIAPVSLRVDGRVLLYKLQARIHDIYINKKNLVVQGSSCLTRRFSDVVHKATLPLSPVYQTENQLSIIS